jgi:ketosteroid isomerase-like protein
MSTTRRAVLAAAGPALASAAMLPGAPSPAADLSQDAGSREVADLVLRAEHAHAALMRGDLARYRLLITTPDDFTLMAPFGGKPTRAADLSSERWEAIARFFRNGRDSTLELVEAYHSTDLVVLAAIERSHVEVGGLAGQDWALRVTLVFRRDKDQWRLAHRHADPLVEGITLAQAAAMARRPSS